MADSTARVVGTDSDTVWLKLDEPRAIGYVPVDPRKILKTKREFPILPAERDVALND